MLKRTSFLSIVGLGLVAAWISGAAERATTHNDGPAFTADRELKRPADYREWVFLSAGLGMTYGPTANRSPDENPSFDNVFVNRSAYREFVSSGRWPDKTVFVLEIRGSHSKGSINNGGHFQGEVTEVEAHVKDDRLPGKWAFYSFPNGSTTAKAIPASASCYSCHAEHGAVDTTFVQFYPTLIPIAEAKGTMKE